MSHLAGDLFHFLLVKQQQIGSWQLPWPSLPYSNHTSPFWYISGPLPPHQPSLFSVGRIIVEAFPLLSCKGLAAAIPSAAGQAAAASTAVAVVEGGAP